MNPPGIATIAGQLFLGGTLYLSLAVSLASCLEGLTVMPSLRN